MEWTYQRENTLLEEMGPEEGRAGFLAVLYARNAAYETRSEESSSSGIPRPSSDTGQEGRRVLQASSQTAWLYASSMADSLITLKMLPLEKSLR